MGEETMKTGKVSWLQISDLHILLHSPSWEDYKNAMFRFFENDPEKKPDFVVITGDYCNIQKEEPYELAEDFIRKLMELLGLSVSKDLFMIPGNTIRCPGRTAVPLRIGERTICRGCFPMGFLRGKQ